MATVIGATASVATTASTTIRPASGVQWQINSICVAAAASIVLTDGTNGVEFSSPTGAGAVEVNLQLSNDLYITVTNDDASTQVIGYTGFIIV